jgi:hypothetical protein
MLSAYVSTEVFLYPYGYAKVTPFCPGICALMIVLAPDISACAWARGIAVRSAWVIVWLAISWPWAARALQAFQSGQVELDPSPVTRKKEPLNPLALRAGAATVRWESQLSSNARDTAPLRLSGQGVTMCAASESPARTARNARTTIPVAADFIRFPFKADKKQKFYHDFPVAGSDRPTETLRSFSLGSAFSARNINLIYGDSDEGALPDTATRNCIASAT